MLSSLPFGTRFSLQSRCPTPLMLLLFSRATNSSVFTQTFIHSLEIFELCFYVLLILLWFSLIAENCPDSLREMLIQHASPLVKWTTVCTINLLFWGSYLGLNKNNNPHRLARHTIHLVKKWLTCFGGVFHTLAMLCCMPWGNQESKLFSFF